MDQDSKDRLRRSKLPEPQLKRFRQLSPHWPTRNVAFRNRGDGTFQPTDREWGFDHLGVSYGMALADLDNDGDLDVVVNNLNEAPSLYRNDTTAGRIQVRLKGTPPNTQGIGARLRLSGGPVTQRQEMICGGRYMSCDQAVRVFASGPDFAHAERLEVTWRNGDFTSLEVLPNRIYEVNQAGASPQETKAAAPSPQPIFADVSSLLGHIHVEDSFDDWARQPLLPRRLSRLGPGLSWFDFDGDGWEDLMVTAGRGGKLAVFLNQNGQQFRQVEGSPSRIGRPGRNCGLAGRQGTIDMHWSPFRTMDGTRAGERNRGLYAGKNGRAPTWPAGLAEPWPVGPGRHRRRRRPGPVSGRALPPRPLSPTRLVWHLAE